MALSLTCYTDKLTLVKQGRIIYKDLMHQTIVNKFDFARRIEISTYKFKELCLFSSFSKHPASNSLHALHPEKRKKKKKSMMEEHQGNQNPFN